MSRAHGDRDALLLEERQHARCVVTTGHSGGYEDFVGGGEPAIAKCRFELTEGCVLGHWNAFRRGSRKVAASRMPVGRIADGWTRVSWSIGTLGHEACPAEAAAIPAAHDKRKTLPGARERLASALVGTASRGRTPAV